MNNGLLDLGIVSFAFAPLVMTVVILWVLWWKRRRATAEPLLPSVRRTPTFGILAVALPPLGLPFIYGAAVIVEAMGGSPLTPASRWSYPDAVIVMVKIIMLLTVGCMVAGVPLGLAGWLRRERMRWLSVMGMISSTGILIYFLTVMHFLSGGD
jgi:hypothetical protein